MSLLAFLFIGLLAGAIAGRLVQGKGYGLTTNLIIGVIGAVIGGGLFNFLGLSGHGFIIELAAAVVGAIVLIAIARLVKRL